jgi:glucosyl-dolichyl phosphate glucuronosyltransferase
MAVDSLEKQTLLPEEIILVIDHNPALYELARQEFVGVSVVENQFTRGLSGARNTGILLAHGAILAFIDEDAIAEPTWLERLLRVYNDPNVMGAGGAILPYWTELQPAWFPEEFNWVIGCTYKGMPETVAPVRNLIGCNMSFRREVFDVAGGFRTGMGRIGILPLGCEETELCIRAGRFYPKKELLYLPGAMVRHRVPPSRARLGYFLDRCYSEGLSKAQVARFVGANRGLATERAYTLHTLPAGVLHGLRDLLAHRDLFGLGRALAIIAGLGFTTFGYILGHAAELLRRTPADGQLSGEADYQ